MEKLSNIKDPGELTWVWKDVWSILGERMGRPNIDVPPCGMRGKMLEEIGEKGRVALYVPEEVSAPGALPGLLEAIYWGGRYFGKAVSIDGFPVYSYGEIECGNGRWRQWGWMHTEEAGETPNVGRGADRRRGVEPMTLNTYVVGLYVNALAGIFWDLSPEGFTNPRQRCRVGRSVVKGRIPVVTTVITATDQVVPRLGIRTESGIEGVGERTVVRVKRVVKYT